MPLNLRVLESKMGTNFMLECDMSEGVLRWLRRQNLSVKSEFALPWGICDFVGVQFDQAHVNKRLRLGQGRPIGPLPRVELLRHIPERESGAAVTFRELQRSYATTFFSSTLQHELQLLIDNRFVVCNA